MGELVNGLGGTRAIVGGDRTYLVSGIVLDDFG